jgi:hypothetical protein
MLNGMATVSENREFKEFRTRCIARRGLELLCYSAVRSSRFSVAVKLKLRSRAANTAFVLSLAFLATQHAFAQQIPNDKLADQFLPLVKPVDVQG